jgi:hypothetical protein
MTRVRHTRVRRASLRSLIVLATAVGLSASAVAAGGVTTSPPTATTGQVISVLPTSATVAGVVNPHASSTTWYFEFGLSTDASFGSTTAVGNLSATSDDDDVTTTLAGLSPATSYHYRLVATNAGGTSYGGAGIFNTSAAPSVVTAAASQLTASSATLNGLLNPEALSTEWYFQYGSTTAYGSKTPEKALAASPNISKVSAAVANLGPQATYHYRLVAVSSAGTTYGVDFALTTGLPVTINSAQSTVVYGGLAILSGVVTSGLAGQHVTLENEAFSANAFTGFAAITTAAGGSWSYSVQPSARTTYEAVANGGTSSPIVVSVRPAVYVTLESGGLIATHVTAGVSFADHVLQLQRLSQGNWVQWKQVRLNSSAKVTFSTSLPIGRTSIRMAIGPFVLGINQAAPGYLSGFSRSVTYDRG